MFALVVHADADQHLHSLEVVPHLLPLRQLPQVMHQSVDWLEVADLVLLRRVVVDDLGAVGGTDARQVLTQGCTSICHDQSFVETWTAEDVQGHERTVLSL